MLQSLYSNGLFRVLQSTYSLFDDFRSFEKSLANNHRKDL